MQYSGRAADQEMPPANPEAEAGLLRSLMALPEAAALPEVVAVQPGDFCDPAYRTILRHLVGAWLAGQEPETLPARMMAAGEWSEAVKHAVRELMAASVSGSDAAYFAGLVRETAKRRRLWELSGELRRQVDDCLPADDVDGFLRSYLDAHDPCRVERPTPLPQLIADYPELRPSVIGGLLREAEIGNFVSMSKVGKSWLGYGLGLAVMTGGFWLGRFSARRGKVLLIDNELDRRTIAFRVRQVAKSLGIDDTSDFHVHSLRGQLVDIYQLGTFLRQFAAGEYRLVILDALYRFWPARISENDNAAVTAVMNTIASYAERMAAAFALVHHSSKGSQSSKSVTDVGAGAAALSRAADTHLVLREHESDGAVVLEARTRSWEQPEPMVLRWQFPVWTAADDLDPAALKSSAKAAIAKPSRMVAMMQKVREALAAPATKNALRTAASASGTEITSILQSLTEAGEIEPCDVQTGGGLFAGYRRCASRSEKVGEGRNSEVSEGRSENSLKGSSPLRPTHRQTVTPTRHPEFDEWNSQ